MNLYLISLVTCFIIFYIFIYKAYQVGTKQTFKRFLAILIPLVFAGTAVRIGYILLPKSNQLSFYIAGIGTLLFYSILSPVLRRINPDRYRKISKNSRLLACIIGVFEAWLVISFIVFFLNQFYPNYTENYKQLINIFTLPIRFIWFFS